MRDRGKRRGGTCGPKVQKDRMQGGAGAVFGWHLFWVFCRAGPSPGVKSCLSDHNRGNVGKGGRWGGGQGSLDKPAHTRQMFAQKNTGKLSCKYNRESLLSHTAGFSACLLSSVSPIGVRRGWGQGWGMLGEVCSAYPCWPPPLRSPGEQSFLCKCHPQS